MYIHDKGVIIVNNDRVILELLRRISVLEEKVAILENANHQDERANEKITQMPSKKYRLLSDYLYTRGEPRISLSFKDIENILEFELPDSAHNHRAFWANTKTHSIALSWLGVGYETVEVDIDDDEKEKQIIVFERKRKYES